ncbi:MAG: DNA topoisomerase IB [Marmoricola sp.]
MRLRTVSCQQPGWRRIGRGRGFSYVDHNGDPVAPEDVQRIRDLVIPPAWREVWICPHPRGHLQAVGTDADGRRQYLYHPQWRVQRDVEKFERVSQQASQLPRLRRRLRADLRATADDELTERRRILAAAIRMLDLGCFRPGSDASADSGSHGLTTLERQHVRREGAALWFHFEGKAGVEHEILIDDPDVVRVIDALMRRRRGSARLLASRRGRRWVPISPEELNQRIQELVGEGFTAKDFRTWHATTMAAVTLAAAPPPTGQRARQRRLREAIVAASDLLGNTPTVARSSYVDPRVVELFEQGVVLDPVPRSENAVDRAVAALLAQA